MSCFKIPTTLCKELEMLVCKFWRGSQENDWKIHRIDWEKSCWPKVAGRMGFQDLNSFSFGILAKQRWRLMKDENTLVAKILRAWYYPRGDFMNATMGSKPIFTWRSLMAGKEVLEKGVIRRMGNGLSIDVREHAWIPTNPNFKVGHLKPSQSIFNL